MSASLLQRSLGEKSVSGDGAILVRHVTRLGVESERRQRVHSASCAVVMVKLMHPIGSRWR
jgi:hypothetical protein